MIGGTIRQSVDVRIISTSTSPLDKLIEAGHFREDLFYALSSAQFILPSLSERRGDVGPLTRHLLTRIGGLPGMKPLGVTDDALRLLRSEEHTSELQSLMRISYAVFCLKKKKTKKQ